MDPELYDYLMRTGKVKEAQAMGDAYMTWGKKNSFYYDDGNAPWSEEAEHNIEAEYAKIQRKQDKLKKHAEKLKKLEALLNEKQRVLELTPTKRMKAALELEAKLESDKAKFEAKKQGHKRKVDDFKIETKEVQKELDRAAGLIESECQKIIGAAEKKLEAAGKKSGKALKQKEKELETLSTDLKNEDKRLTKMRHDLSDKEASLIRRETAVRNGETRVGANPSTPSNSKVRELEI